MTVFASLLNNAFTVSRRVRSSDGQGGHTIAYVEIGTVQGRIRPSSGSEREIADSEEQQISHVLYVAAENVPAYAGIARGDLIECGDLAVEVLGIREPSLAGEHLEIDCLERQNESTEEYGS